MGTCPPATQFRDLISCGLHTHLLSPYMPAPGTAIYLLQWWGGQTGNGSQKGKKKKPPLMSTPVIFSFGAPGSVSTSAWTKDCQRSLVGFRVQCIVVYTRGFVHFVNMLCHWPNVTGSVDEVETLWGLYGRWLQIVSGGGTVPVPVCQCVLLQCSSSTSKLLHALLGLHANVTSWTYIMEDINFWLRTMSHINSHYTWRSFITMHDFGSVLGQPMGTSLGLTQFHGHYS